MVKRTNFQWYQIGDKIENVTLFSITKFDKKKLGKNWRGDWDCIFDDNHQCINGGGGGGGWIAIKRHIFEFWISKTTIYVISKYNVIKNVVINLCCYCQLTE